MNLVLKLLISIGTKLLTEKVLTELFIFGAKQLAASTKTKADDELVKIIDKHLN